MNEKFDRALQDFQAGAEAGRDREKQRWLKFLRQERADAMRAKADADPTSDEETERPDYVNGWHDALDYIVHMEGSYVSKD